MKPTAWITRVISAVTLALAPQILLAETALIATATNFSEVADALQADFEAKHDHSLTIVTGSTGKLYAQIVNGAPFDVFLAADQVRPRRLIDDGLALPDSLFTFATGQIVLWSVDPTRIGTDGHDALKSDFRRLAIANPQLAPYGVAAIEALGELGILEALQDKIVMGENIGQTHALIASGNAELGVVALAYAVSPRNETKGSFWRFPRDTYAPIHQDAVQISRSADNPAAVSFVSYLNSEAAKTIIREHGYEVE